MNPADRRHYWQDFAVGDVVPAVEFPLPVHRLIVAAGGNRDFNAIHHNSRAAQASGAPDIYANNIFLMGMWERTIREFVGCLGQITAVRNMTMRRFNVAGETVVTRGRVERVWSENDAGLVEISIESVNNGVLTVGPGSVMVRLPFRRD